MSVQNVWSVRDVKKSTREQAITRTKELNILVGEMVTEALDLWLKSNQDRKPTEPPGRLTVLERLDKLEVEITALREALKERQGEEKKEITPKPSAPSLLDKTALKKRIQGLKQEGLSLQAIAVLLNDEGTPTLSGKGQWHKGTVGKLARS